MQPTPKSDAHCCVVRNSPSPAAHHIAPSNTRSFAKTKNKTRTLGRIPVNKLLSSIKLPVFQSGFQEVFPKRSHDSLEREGSRPAIRNALQSRHGRTPDALCGVLQKSFESRPDCNSVRPIRGAEGGVSQTPQRFIGETLPPSTCRSNLRNYQGGEIKKIKKSRRFWQSKGENER